MSNLSNILIDGPSYFDIVGNYVEIGEILLASGQLAGASF